MNQQLPKRLLNIGIIILSLLTATLAILSIINSSNWLFRIFTQGSLGILMLFNGIRDIAYNNKKTLGYLSISVSIFLFYVMFFTIYVAFKIGAF